MTTTARKLPPVLDVEASLLELTETVFEWNAEILSDENRANFSAASVDKLASLSYTGDDIEPSEIALGVRVVSDNVELRQLAGLRLAAFISTILQLDIKEADKWIAERLSMKTQTYTKSGFRVSLKPLREQGFLIVSVTSQGFRAD